MRFSGLRLRYRQSLVAVPSLYVVAACLLGVLVPTLDRDRDAPAAPDAGVGAARDILGATATGMIAFTGFVVAGVLVVVQFAAAQYSPRLVLWFRRDTLTKHAIGVFLAAFVYALVALWRLEADVAGFRPDITVIVALLLLVGACVLFLALLQRVTDRLRPRTLYGAVVRQGIHAARETWPDVLRDDAEPADRSWATADPQHIALEGRPGVVASIDRAALVAAAARADAVVELVPALGEFVGAGDGLLRIHGARLEPGSVRGLVHLADERTIELDPAFAIRIVVDTAIRALSPAVNDPTTAVQGLDVLELLVREMSTRDMDASVAYDDAGRRRLVWRSPSWDDVLDLAFEEIRDYGGGSLQICRRLRALLQDLLATTPARRHPALQEHLRRLDATVQSSFPAGSAARDLAQVADRTGIGLARR